MSKPQDIFNEMKLTALQLSSLQRVFLCSPFATRLLSQDKGLLADLLENSHVSYRLLEMQSFLAQHKINDEASLKKALRKLRQQVVARLIFRDLNDLADLSEVLNTISELADFAINTAVDHLHGWQIAEYGEPVDEHGVPQTLVVIGMGKLGGMELNVSSDVDLIFAYEQDGKTVGDTNGEKSISNQDYFVRLGKKLIAALDEPTADGFVFRVDMGLRPFGSEGVLVSSLDALENYYQNNGREWERYAWVKGREVTGGNAVSQLLKPFVYRKYLDYNAFASMRDLKVQIQRDVNAKSAKATGGKDNIKLGRGGIREVEFIAQVFQLIRGGQEPALQIRPTLQVLALLKTKRLLPGDAADRLCDAYVFLRNVEHRLMYLEDAQSQDLPKSEAARACVATAMDFDGWDDFMAALNQYRGFVRVQFDQTFSLDEEKNDEADAQGPSLTAAKSIWDGELDDEQSLAALEALGYQRADDTLKQIQRLHQGHHYQQLPELSRQRFNQLLPVLIKVASHVGNPDIALMRTMDFIDAICRRASYLALLAEYPQALSLVVRLCGASTWCAQYLTQHPIVLDELLDEASLYATPDFAVLRHEITQTMKVMAGDVEQQMNAMRHFKHAAIFRFISQDITGQLSLETLSDYLSALADLIVDVSIQTIWQSLNFKHIEKPKFAVIGYGKLGGKELGYASDLDVIFLFEDAAEDAGSIYARFAQRISSWFNSLTPAGLLYETDLELRPDGNSGLLVSSTEAFNKYQSKRAWVWEHQAITRARFIAGDVSVGNTFEAIRVAVMRQQRDLEKLCTEVFEMREKMRHAQHFTVDLFDLKQSKGGIIDVEFIVQYLVLAHARKHDVLTENIGNIALLATLGDLGVIDIRLAQQSAGAYREYRSLQHAARMQGEMDAKVEHALVEQYAKAVIGLWNTVFTVAN